MNSRRSGSPGALAIENERCSPSAPGIPMSTYWPALNSSASGSVTFRTSRRMSCVSSSTASTSVVASTIGVPLRMRSSS